MIAGPQKRNQVLSAEERKRTAYHESGHAIVAAASGNADNVHRITILARGRGLGQVNLHRETDAVLLTRQQLMAQIVTAMAGLAAEELVFGDPSTGAELDLQGATDLARDMIGRYGMGSHRSRLLAKGTDQFLEGEIMLGHVPAQTHQEMQNEIDQMLEDSEREAIRLLTQHRDVLDNLAERLEAEETLEGVDLEGLLSLVRPEVSLFAGFTPVEGNGRAAHASPAMVDEE